jgi:hypothetical protein
MPNAKHGAGSSQDIAKTLSFLCSELNQVIRRVVPVAAGSQGNISL